MMIKYIQIENFKSLKSLRLKPSNLNLCFGMNGMGKSTLLQSMLLLRQSHLKGVLHSKGLLLNDKDLISIGSGKDAFHYDAGKKESLRFEIHTENDSILKWHFRFDAISDILPFDSHEIDPHSGLDGYSLFNNNFQYLTAEHIGPQKQYPKSDSEVRQNRNIGIKGEYAVHYLSLFGNNESIKYENLRHKAATSDTLLHQTAAWLGEISPGTRLITEDIKGVDTVRLGFQFETKSGYTNEFSPVNVGFGILYVLPVVLSLLKATPGSIIFIENPESHLHPKGQSAIGRLMALAAQNGVQIFCESHSDHIINGIRVAVRNKEIDHENLAIFYFDRNMDDDEHKARVSEVFTDQKGELSVYPEGLLDEWNSLLTQLI